MKRSERSSNDHKRVQTNQRLALPSRSNKNESFFKENSVYISNNKKQKHRRADIQTGVFIIYNTFHGYIQSINLTRHAFYIRNNLSALSLDAFYHFAQSSRKLSIKFLRTNREFNSSIKITDLIFTVIVCVKRIILKDEFVSNVQTIRLYFKNSSLKHPSEPQPACCSSMFLNFPFIWA